VDDSALKPLAERLITVGGGWLAIAGQRVDWIYRDLDRVHRVRADCQQGRYEIGVQAGHPLGFYSHAYAGEVALCRVLADPSGEVGELQHREYPEPLARALVDGLWEADFAVRLASYGASGADPTYAAGCLFRAVGVACQAMHGHARRWLVNEKGMVASAAQLPGAPEGFAERAHRLFGVLGKEGAEVARTVRDATDLIDDVRRMISPRA